MIQVLDANEVHHDMIEEPHEFKPGQRVRICAGVFENFLATVEKVEAETGRVHVAIVVFGRSTPVELDWWECESIP